MKNRFGGIPVNEASSENRFGGIPVSKEMDFDAGDIAAETARSAVQGFTFGFGDELESGLSGIVGSMQGEPFQQAYRQRYRELERRRKAFEEQYPGIAIPAELTGGLLTGGFGAARTGALQGLNQLSKLGKVGRLAKVGAVEGGIYGAGKADPDEIVEDAIEGAALGSVVTPVAGGTLNVLGDLISGVGDFASRKLVDTPRQQADRVLRQAMADEGMTPEAVVARIRELNEAIPGTPQATMADVGDAFRTQARATMDVGDSAKGKARDLFNQRQAGQRARVKTLINKNFGADADNFFSDFDSALTKRAEAASPIYERAFNQGVEMTEELEDFIADPLIKSSYSKAQKFAASLKDPGDLNLRTLDQLKKRLDDKIGSSIKSGERETARAFQMKKTELLDLIGQQNPDYRNALAQFSSDSAIINAMENGLEFLKRDPDLLKQSLKGLTETEKDSFRIGAVKSLQNFIESQGDNTDVVKRLIGSEAMRKRLQSIMPEENVDNFLKGLNTEAEFFRTRGAITSGPNTAERLQAAERLNQEISPDLLVSLGMGDPTFIVPQVARVLSKGKASPELVDALSDSLFDAGLTGQQIIDILSKPTVRKQFSDRYDETIGKIINKDQVRSGITPAVFATTDED